MWVPITGLSWAGCSLQHSKGHTHPRHNYSLDFWNMVNEKLSLLLCERRAHAGIPHLHPSGCGAVPIQGQPTFPLSTARWLSSYTATCHDKGTLCLTHGALLRLEHTCQCAIQTQKPDPGFSFGFPLRRMPPQQLSSTHLILEMVKPSSVPSSN